MLLRMGRGGDGSILAVERRRAFGDEDRELRRVEDADAELLGLGELRAGAGAGREGTVAGRMRGTAAEGNCRTKTGTLSGVSALSGYCDAGSETLAFSILMNGVDVVRARNAQDGMASLIARFRR